MRLPPSWSKTDGTPPGPANRATPSRIQATLAISFDRSRGAIKIRSVFPFGLIAANGIVISAQVDGAIKRFAVASNSVVRGV